MSDFKNDLKMLNWANETIAHLTEVNTKVLKTKVIEAENEKPGSSKNKESISVVPTYVLSSMIKLLVTADPESDLYRLAQILELLTSGVSFPINVSRAEMYESQLDIFNHVKKISDLMDETKPLINDGEDFSPIGWVVDKLLSEIGFYEIFEDEDSDDDDDDDDDDEEAEAEESDKKEPEDKAESKADDKNEPKTESKDESKSLDDIRDLIGLLKKLQEIDDKVSEKWNEYRRKHEEKD